MRLPEEQQTCETQIGYSVLELCIAAWGTSARATRHKLWIVVQISIILRSEVVLGDLRTQKWLDITTRQI
jgi:hypothetical protein